MKYKEIKEKNINDLNDTIKEKREALRVFTFGTSGARSKNVKEGHVLKKDIARIMTEMTVRKAAK